ncbi:DUF2784 domain-containing protein [Nocardiopsis sp. NRRL B-16309]|uniref:DUF2784 domain-containing protein n=1 Tax=Nocardiopsis sp. NRRL B-16309 TaxID=1519494 RepID=UPI0006AE6796|nr:DUF2784 domain-containing protein [Nocardiopsis sp. NRRL B-16309]KOX15743.1 membrane protein [Nocardiopsis sp. NRRL B-16309]
MTHLLIGHTAMVLHFAFFGYVVLGGFLAWRWPRALWPHVGTAAYALGIVIVDWPCVLTEVENWSRAATGRTVMESGFIDFHITGTLYPPEHLLTSRLVIAGVIALSWAGAAVVRARCRDGRPRRAQSGHGTAPGARTHQGP